MMLENSWPFFQACHFKLSKAELSKYCVGSEPWQLWKGLPFLVPVVKFWRKKSQHLCKKARKLPEISTHEWNPLKALSIRRCCCEAALQFSRLKIVVMLETRIMLLWICENGKVHQHYSFIYCRIFRSVYSSNFQQHCSIRTGKGQNYKLAANLLNLNTC